MQLLGQICSDNLQPWTATQTRFVRGINICGKADHLLFLSTYELSALICIVVVLVVFLVGTCQLQPLGILCWSLIFKQLYYLHPYAPAVLPYYIGACACDSNSSLPLSWSVASQTGGSECNVGFSAYSAFFYVRLFPSQFALQRCLSIVTESCTCHCPKKMRKRGGSTSFHLQFRGSQDGICTPRSSTTDTTIFTTIYQFSIFVAACTLLHFTSALS